MVALDDVQLFRSQQKLKAGGLITSGLLEVTSGNHELKVWLIAADGKAAREYLVSSIGVRAGYNVHAFSFDPAASLGGRLAVLKSEESR